MSDLATKHMLDAYIQASPASRFFTRFFRPKFYTTRTVELDIVRSEEDVAVVINDLSTGARMNSVDRYTNKEYEAPAYEEAVPLDVHSLLDREAGNNPFAAINFQMNATAKMLQGISKVEAKIRRAVELQASQVLQTGTATLIDTAGDTLFSIDYSPKATHFPTVAIDWGDAGYDPLGDIQSLAGVIRSDGLTKPNILIFGETAWNLFIKNTDVQAILNNRRIDAGAINFVDRGDEATSHGPLSIGDFSFEMFTVGSRYTHPQSGVSTPFMTPDKVVVMDSRARLDGTFGAVPSVVAPDSRVMPFLPSRISNINGGIDMFPNAWVSPDGRKLFGSVAARPLMIPVAIDSFGCINTIA